jgi:hypothetical protein
MLRKYSGGVADSQTMPFCSLLLNLSGDCGRRLYDIADDMFTISYDKNRGTIRWDSVNSGRLRACDSLAARVMAKRIDSDVPEQIINPHICSNLVGPNPGWSTLVRSFPNLLKLVSKKRISYRDCSMLRLSEIGARLHVEVWHYRANAWIGDAKYKHLAKDQVRALRFSDFEDEQTETENVESLAGQVLNPADIRQLTVYAELVRLREKTATPPNLMLLYPFVGPASQSLPDEVTAWNGSTFCLMPVQVKRQKFIGDAIRFSSN